MASSSVAVPPPADSAQTDSGKLIEADPAQPRHIRTVWGVGYVFVPDGTAPGGGRQP